MSIEILSCRKEKSNYLVIPKDNCFYIDGKGGQLGDRGHIGDANVLEVTKDGIIIDRELSPGSYDYDIDVIRQKDIAEQHTAEHIFSGIVYQKYGFHNIGFRMGEEYTTIDLDIQDIDTKIADDMEIEVNKAIEAGVDIKIKVIPHTEALQMTTLRKPLSPKITGDVRIVEVPGYDLCACAGFHVKNTKDIRLFKILHYEKVKGGNTRFYFISGDKAYRDYKLKHEISRELCHRFSCQDDEIVTMLDKSYADKKNIESELKNVSMKYAGLLAKELSQNAMILNDHKVIYYDEDRTVASFLARYIDLDSHLLITGADGAYTLASNAVDCKALIKCITDACHDIKGGGSATKGNIKGNINKEILFGSIKRFFE